MNKDLTIGNPQRVLWAFCLPLFGSIIFQQIYNIADSLIAGQFIGENALAAVGNSYEVTLIFLAFAFGCNIGTSVIVSQFFGAKDIENMKTTVSTAFIATGILCFTLMMIGVFGSDMILNIIHTPQNVYNESKLYLDIYVWGLPFVFFYNLSTGIFSALGDSKTPFYFLAVSSVTNILVDLYFVCSLRMGVSGVAWATFLCQGLSCILAMFVVLKRLKQMQSEQYIYFSLDILKDISRIAIPSILQQSFISVGNMCIRGLINSFGTGVMAGYSVAIKLNNLVITSFTTLGNGISNFTAQNLGAKKYERIEKGFHAGKCMVWLLSAPIVLLYIFGGRLLISFFMENPSIDAMNNGLLILKIFSPFYFIISIKLVADGILRGSGLMKQFMFATFTDLILRVVIAFVLSQTSLQATGIWFSWPIGWVIACMISLYFYKQTIKRQDL